MPFILEYDRGTETGERLARKLPGYRRLLSVSASPVALLFCFESTRREVAARRALAKGPPDLATAVVPRGASPAGRSWLPLGGSARLRLAELVQRRVNDAAANWVSAEASAARSAQAGSEDGGSGTEG